MSRASGMAGRVALVTGGGLGIGAATAQAFGADGATVVIADIDRDAGEETASGICADGGDATFVLADVGEEADVEMMIRRTVERHSRLDYAVNNAATRPDTQPLSHLDMEMFDRVVGINLRAVAMCLKHEIRQMLIQASPCAIVNVASIAGLRPQPSSPAYVAAKAGVIGLTKSASLDFGPRNIRVNAVAPGAINTPMLEQAIGDLAVTETDVTGTLSLFKRLGEPHEVAEAIHWLCSDRASLVTGIVMPVDAGYTSI